MAKHDPFGFKRSLFMLTDPDLPRDDAVDRARRGIRGGATHVIVRRPNSTPMDVFRITELLRESGGGAVLVHERVDIALATDAHGTVHSLNGIPGSHAKKLLATGRMMGMSVHSLEEALHAERQQAEFVLFGNVYETESHPGKPGEGIDALARVVQNISIPVIAIGGITAERVDDVLSAGAFGVAVIRAISRADDPEAAAGAIRERLDTAPYPHLR